MQPWVIGVDLGGTKIELGLVDSADHIVARRRIVTDAQLGAQSVVERIAACVDDLATHVPTGQRIAALGICTPGPVDHVNGVILDPPNIQGLHNAPLSALLSTRLSMPVQLEHDAKAAALGEFYFGAGRDETSMVYLIIGTGVGAALIIDGQIYRGLHNFAGEIGHTVLDRHGPVCSCGHRGCVETFMSGPWLARHYAAASQNQKSVSGADVATLAMQGDPLAIQVLAQAGAALGTTIATLAMLVNIDLYVIGGSVAQCGALLLAPARQAVPQHAFASVAAHVRIVASALATDAPILGCAWLARQIINRSPQEKLPNE